MNFGDILADRDFGLQMRFARADVAAFFKPGDSHAAVIAERRKWIAGDPQVHCALLPPGVPLLDETVELALSLDTLPVEVNAGTFVVWSRWPAAGIWAGCGRRISCS